MHSSVLIPVRNSRDQGLVSAYAYVGALAPYLLLTFSVTYDEFSSYDTMSLLSTRSRPNTPKRLFYTVEILQNTHEKYAIYICIMQIYQDISAEHCTLGFVKSVLYKRPIK